MIQNFYDRQEWRELRFKVLRKHGYKCMACGKGQREGAIIQVDHIKPKANFPELALDESNLQVLCRECNLGKLNHFADDLRPPKPPRIKRHPKNFGNDPHKVDVWQERKFARYAQMIKGALNVAETAGDVVRRTELLRAYLGVRRSMKQFNTKYDES